MSFFSFDGKSPTVGKDCFIAESAEVIGDVTIGDRCYVGFGAILRADYGRIVIGDETAVEEGCICHAKPSGLLTIGSRVTLGHGAIVHGKEIEDEAVIGMGAVIGFDTRIGKGAVVAEGTVVKAGTNVSAGVMVAGMPATKVRNIDAGQRRFIDRVKEIYIDLAKTYSNRLKRIEIAQ